MRDLYQNNSEDPSFKRIIINIPIESIKPNPYQPRKNFNKVSLDELAKSIEIFGVIQPISVRRMSHGGYELVTGERRLRAAKIAGLEMIPAILINVNDDASAVIALIENLQREELGYFEEADALAHLINEHRMTQEYIAEQIGKNQSTVANKIRLLKLPPLVRKIIADNELSERHARALLKVHDEQLQLKILGKITDRKLNVKQTEDLVNRIVERLASGSVPDEKKHQQKVTRAIKDVKIFINTVKQAIDLMKKSGVNAKAAQIDKGEYVEFIVRIPKKNQMI